MSNPQNHPGDRDWREWPPPPGSGNDPGATPSAFGGLPHANQYGGYPPGPLPPARRPGVLIAAVVLWVLIGLFALIAGIVLIAVSGSEQTVNTFVGTLEDRGFANVDDETVRTALVAVGVVVVVLGILEIASALVMLRRQNWARVLVTIVGVLVGIAMFRTFLVPAGVVIAIILQFLAPSNQWFRTRPGRGYGPYG